MAGRIAYRPIFHVIGILLTILGIGMLVPALVDVSASDMEWKAFVGSSAVTLAVSGGMVLATTSREQHRFTVKQHFLITTLSWVVLAAFGALPFILSSMNLSFTDAYYEAMSGLSTNGGTVIVGLDDAPPGLLLWRSILTWFGGVGIIVMAIAVLPVLRVGGMQLFRTESSDKASEKPYATMRETAGAIALIYMALTMLSALAYRLAGMGWFDAINHAMTSIATGGFSTKDTSLAWFQSDAVLWVATFSMIAGAIPLTWYIRSLRRSRGARLMDSQVSTMLVIIAASSLAMTLWVALEVDLPFWIALTHATVNVTSVITTTGYSSADYSGWGNFPLVAFFFFYFIGGCTGSTSGSIKIFRWQVLAQSMLIQMQRMLKPHRVLVPLYQGKPLEEEVIASVINFAFAYMTAFGVLSLLVAAMGVDFLSASSSVAASLAGAGAGLGPDVGPVGSYSSMPEAAKWVLSFAMLLGRLEVFTILVLFLPTFWRD